MAGERILHAKEERRPASGRTGDTVDYPFLILVLLLLAAAGVALFFVILRWMRSSSRKKVPETECLMGTMQRKNGNAAGKRRFSAWGWIGVVISAGYMIFMDFFVMVL